MRGTGLGILAFVFGVVVIVALVIGGWQAGWWFTKQNTDRQYGVNVHSQQFQAAQIDQLRNDVQGYDASDVPAQQAQIKAEFCAVYPNLTQPPRDLVMAANRIGC